MPERYDAPEYAGARKRYIKLRQRVLQESKRGYTPNEYHRGYEDGYDGQVLRESGELYMLGYAQAVERYIQAFHQGPCCLLVRPEAYKEE